MIEKIAIIGAGRLAWHLTHALKAAGEDVNCIWSRTRTNAEKLANAVGARAVVNLSDLPNDISMVIIAVSDMAVSEIALALDRSNCLIAHTSGSLPMTSLEQAAVEYGVLYPIQSFTKERAVNFGIIPVLIEASTKSGLERLLSIAHKLSKRVEIVSSERRRQLHLAAVFVNNFGNHLLTIGEDLCKDKGLDFSLLYPLIEETSQKAFDIGPRRAQTGPAVRYDTKVIEAQLELLANRELYQKIYTFVSKSIFELQKK